MVPGDNAHNSSQRSTNACNSCRKRKVKCDRVYPSCQVCEQTGQDCTYPLKLKKPGPKIGSLQKHKRQYREQHAAKNGDQLRSRESASPGQHMEEDVEMNHWSAGINGEDSDSQVETQNTGWARKRRNSKLNINSLSFILHPSHEASTPEKDSSSATLKETPEHERQGLMQQACLMLGLSQEMARFMVHVYFNNMVAINLFHKPTFTETISNFTNPVHICALIAAMCGFGAKFYNADLDLAAEMAFLRAEAATHSPDHFLTIGLNFVNEALTEYEEEAPPIHVVQALIIITHCQLTKGVHGKAWRLLGMCVRLAYELNLHLVDAMGVTKDTQDDPTIWRDAEERRRAWWAIWEMDVFASTIRRTPTAIDWAHMETLLPVDDVDWFQDKPARSAFMEPDPNWRWKVLQEAGNHSPKAWFLIINSLMKDAQIISSPRGVPCQPDQDQRQHANSLYPRGEDPRNQKLKLKQKLEMLDNSVQCFILALPQHLKFRNQYLGFDPSVSGQIVSTRQLHCGIYNIYVMTQLARLMIHRYNMFGTHDGGLFHPSEGQQRSFGFQDPDNSCVRQYFEAADNILMIVKRSCEDHIQHINPFLPSTIWLAAAVQLVRKYIGGNNIDQGLVKSSFDVLYMTYKRCVEFWDTKTAMEQNLESLEMQLEGQQPARATKEPARQITRSKLRKEKANNVSRERYSPLDTESGSQRNATPDPETRTAAMNRSKEPARRNTHAAAETEGACSPPQFIPNSPPATVMGKNCANQPQMNSITSASPPGPNFTRSHMVLPSGEDGSAASILDFIHMACRDGGRPMMGSSASESPLGPAGAAAPSVPPSAISAAFFGGGQGMPGMQLQPDLNWRNLELPIDIRDVLSGLTTY